jgi:hypothetical protein
MAPLNTLDPHAIVEGLMKKFPGYELAPNPKVPKEYSHPAYFNAESGAWPMSEYVEEAGECQAPRAPRARDPLDEEASDQESIR